MAAPNKKDKAAQLICFCNGVSRGEIESAIRAGCQSLGRIFDRTNAGVGACGGSCQPDLRRMLDRYLKDGTFPEITRPKGRKNG